MSTVILDIETVALPLDAETRHALTKNCKSEAESRDALKAADFSPLTAFVCCVGMRNPDTKRDCVFSIDGTLIDSQWSAFLDGSEAAMLASFWEAVKSYKRIVTFNGRGFDIPFLMTRSAILGVQISRHDLMGNRYASWPHCDLMDQLSHYGATRKHSLDMYCRAFGIPSSKSGCDGSKVGEMYHAGQHQQIAEYCAADCVATAALYDIWLKRLQK